LKKALESIYFNFQNFNFIPTYGELKIKFVLNLYMFEIWKSTAY